MIKQNYQKLLENELCKPETSGKTVVLHSCCAPCSSYVLTYLAGKLHIVVRYYNPNITEVDEYKKRADELKCLVKRLNEEYKEAGIVYTEGQFEPERFLEEARGLEKEPEGGVRCLKCFELRLREAALEAKRIHADFFTTTLTISPLKNATVINEIGVRIANETGTTFLPSDFKKNDGYKKSVELSHKYDLYRQDYCGCPFSKAEARDRRERIQKASAVNEE